MKKHLSILLILLSISFSSAQNLAREISYGGFVGATHSQMMNIVPAIIPEGIYQGFDAKEKGSVGVSGGLFLNWKYPEMKISVQPELYYSKQKTEMRYNDIKGLNYNIGFSYSYLNAGFLLKYYFTDGLYLGAGPFFTLNLDKDMLTYTSNGSELMNQTGVYFEPDAVVQKTLKQSFEGKDYFHAAFAIGYEFENRFGVGLRYQMGLSDALDTLDNGHRYRNTNNKVNAFSLQISYRFQFDSYNNF